MKFSCRFIWLPVLLVLLTMSRTGQAHPISQGTLKVEFLPGHLVLNLEVPFNELEVVGGHGKDALRADLSQEAEDHGHYLLDHFSILTDGQTLSGKSEIQTSSNPSNWLKYRLVFPLGSNPRRLSISQNVLDDRRDAEGYPWTATYLTTVHLPDGSEVMHLLTREQNLELDLPDFVSANASSPTASPSHSLLLDYVKHGIWHILTGYDHLLFMAALVLAATTFGDLVKVVTAFTLAHTATLTLSVLDVFRLQSSIVEPMIAASIVFVAVQNIVSPKASRGCSRLALAFGFGLFHGLGFAGGLLETMAGLSGTTVATAILAFSLGVELGHQCVVVPIFSAIQLGKKWHAPDAAGVAFTAPTIRYGSMLIAAAGSYYLVMALRGA